MNIRMTLAAAIALAASGAAALAHDFWIQPSAFAPKVGEVVKVGLRVGDSFPGEVVRREDSRIELFAAFGEGRKDRTREVVGRDGDKVGGLVRVEQAGTQIVAYRSRPKALTLEAQKFEAYLREEGLEQIIEKRASRGESAKDGREQFSRAAKAIVNVGGEGSTGATVAVGLRLEITPEKDPSGLKAGDELAVVVTFEGKPLAGALVGARTPEDQSAHETVRTDASGRAVFKVRHAGMWLIHSVHMSEAPKDSGVDWESTWSSLTFEISGAAAPAGAGIRR